MSSIRVTMPIPLDQEVAGMADKIRAQMEARAFKAANELRNAELDVLRHQRSGRQYYVPGTKSKYRASTPGQPPAMRTGDFHKYWAPVAFRQGRNWFYSELISEVTTSGKRKYYLGEILEKGTSRMAPRPHQERILKKAKPKIMRIYAQPYDL